jgi:hypothetical protein
MCSGLLLTPVWLPFSSNANPNLVANDHLVADWLEGLADELLVVKWPVDLCGVEQGDSPFHGCAQEADHLVSGRRRTERLAHAHAAEPQGRDLEAGGAEDA